jgi:hypothetical protein
MRRFSKRESLHAIACLTGVVVLWIHLDDFGTSEFRGGGLTDPIFKMAAIGSLLFLLALLLMFFRRRATVTIALAAILL